MRDFGQGLDELTHEERHDYLQMIVEQLVIDRDNNVDITLAIPIDDNSPEPGSPDDRESNSATTQGMDRGSSHDSYHGGLSLARRDRPFWGSRPSLGRRPIAPFFWVDLTNDTRRPRKTALCADRAARLRIPGGGPTVRYASTGEVSCGASAVASKRGPVRPS